MADVIQWRIERLAETDSTNVVASRCVRALWQMTTPLPEAAEGLVIVAETQRAGRGQHGRTWASPVGGLYLSAVVEHVAMATRGKLALVAGVAAAESIAESGAAGIGLRWPNDLMLAGKKVGGILCESVAMGNRWAGIIGVGINVNAPLEDWPGALRGRATSLREHFGERCDLRAVESRLLAKLAGALNLAKCRGLAALIGEVRRLDCLRGERVELSDGGQTIRGVAAGIGQAGELLIETERGTVACARGTVRSVNDEPLRD